MCGVVDDVFGFVGDMFGSFDNILGTMATVGSFIPGPWQVPAMMTSGVLNLANDNPLGAALSFAGAGNQAGMFSNIGSSLGGSGNMMGGLGELSSGGGGLLGSSGGLGEGGGLFSGMSFPGVGGGSSIGASDIFNQFGDTMAGFSGPTVGGGLGTTLTGGAGLSNLWDPNTQIGDGVAASMMSPMNFDDFSGFGAQGLTAPMTGGGGDWLGTLQDLYEKSTTGPGGQLLGGALRGFGAYKDYRGARKTQKAMQSQLDRLDQLYAPDSPYAKQMEKTLARRDAAKGRRSQYGPRAQELASNLTQNQANIWNSPQYGAMLGAANQSAVPWGSVFGAGQSILSGLGGLFR